MKKKEILIYILLSSLLIFPVYRDKSVIDGIAYQWLYLSFFNFFTFLFIVFISKKGVIDIIKSVIKNLYFYFYLIFLFLGSISIYYTENVSLGIVDISRFYIIFSTIISIYVLLKLLKDKNLFFNYLSYIFLIFSSYEVLLVISPIFTKIITLTEIGRSTTLKGIAYNINVTAFSLVIKLPFLFLLASSKSKVKIIWSLILIFFFLISIFQIQSRASFIALLVVVIILSIIKSFRKNFRLLIPIAGSIVFFVVSGLLDNFNQKRIVDTNFILNQDQSTSSRLRYWSDATQTMLENPFSGIGMGSWKTYSIMLDKTKIQAYVIPYHVHNDFLQFGAELGVLGLLIYLGLFTLPLIYLIKIYGIQKKTIPIILIACFFVIIIDSTFNFPRERALIMSYYAMLVAGTFFIMSSDIVNKYETHHN